MLLSHQLVRQMIRTAFHDIRVVWQKKRGVDRCVLKLINAYEYGISSEVEAEDFKKPIYYTKTENQLDRFDRMLKDSCFDNQPKGKQRNDIKIRWKVLESLTKTEEFLRQMENRIKSNGELEHENS